MPVGTGAISLQDVVNEIAGAQTSLVNCVSDHDAAGLDPTYGSTPVTSLSEFRGYDDTPTYYSLTKCSGGSAWTQLVPPIANQRYIDSINPTDFYYYNGSTSTSTQTVISTLQIVATQTFCP